ncbi:MAG TPA: GNAT family N-acetyltransferase [Chloroflexia bacterium]|nr:GNAT family N-acetyltransferase [Chloroflexia bacterium]
MVLSYREDEHTDDIPYIQLRKATQTDFPAIREVAFLSRQKAWGHYMDDNEIESEVAKYYNDDVLNGIISNPANAIFVAEREGRILGYCSVLPKDRRGRPRILQFYVCPKEQRQGIGELLFEKSCDFLRQSGVNDLFVSTMGANMIGRNFFIKKGCDLVYDYTSIWDGRQHEILVFHKEL